MIVVSGLFRVSMERRTGCSKVLGCLVLQSATHCMSWYFVRSVLQHPVSSIMPTSTGITALAGMVAVRGIAEGLDVVGRLARGVRLRGGLNYGIARID